VKASFPRLFGAAWPHHLVRAGSIMAGSIITSLHFPPAISAGKSFRFAGVFIGHPPQNALVDSASNAGST
jgi:hypothetical protein